MKLTAKQFNNNPAAAFRAADKGEEVIITHDRYDVDFKLTKENKDECTKSIGETLIVDETGTIQVQPNRRYIYQGTQDGRPSFRVEKDEELLDSIKDAIEEYPKHIESFAVEV